MGRYVNRISNQKEEACVQNRSWGVCIKKYHWIKIKLAKEKEIFKN